MIVFGFLLLCAGLLLGATKPNGVFTLRDLFAGLLFLASAFTLLIGFVLALRC